MSAHAFSRMLAPLDLGRTVLKNRIWMGSMHTRLDLQDQPVRRLAAFYAERARGGVALMVTGGCSPNPDGVIEAGAATLMTAEQALHEHQPVTEAVHRHGSKILLQLLHAGRNAKISTLVGASDIRSPINRFTPRPLGSEEVEQTVEDFVRSARLAEQAGYDGVEVMGSEGYLIHQFFTERCNNRQDAWGGSHEKRKRFALEIVRRIRAAVGPAFILAYRISALDLAEGGSSADEIADLARDLQAAGVDIFNTGIGWHESAVPTIAYPVPRGSFRFAVARLKRAVSVPVVLSNRINTPELADEIIASGDADMVSMARPLLADPFFVQKAAQGLPQTINTCIACNQACLDHIFSDRTASCLVNPKAGREIDFEQPAPARKQRVAVVGAGPAGMAAAVEAAQRGHRVTLIEASDRIGGQLQLAVQVPGKQEFLETLRYFGEQIARSGVDLRLGTRVSAPELAAGGYDRVIVATGILPRRVDFAGADHPKVVSYLDLLSGRRTAGRRVAVIGMGGIAFDVAEWLTSPHGSSHRETPEEFFQDWGVDTSEGSHGGLLDMARPVVERQVTLLQRSATRVGSRLGLSTGWIHRGRLQRRGVAMLTDCSYQRLDDEGFHVSIRGEPRTLAVDTVVVCAGQEVNRTLADELAALGVQADVIGGANVAAELDAMRAIDEGTRLAWAI